MHGVWLEEIRITTLATLAAFAAVGLVRGGDMRALWAAAAWIGGFEACYHITAWAMGTDPTTAIYFIVAGVAMLAVAQRRAVRPSPAVAVLVVVSWVAWMAFGFRANETDTHAFSVLDEVLNVTAKTLWALAYLVPLARRPSGDEAGADRFRRSVGGVLRP